jgi:hypothetical protein
VFGRLASEGRTFVRLGELAREFERFHHRELRTAESLGRNNIETNCGKAAGNIFQIAFFLIFFSMIPCFFLKDVVE